MQKSIIVLGALVLAYACNSSRKPVDANIADPAITYAATITESELKEHLYTYASDAFEGRETGKPGQKKAVEYLKAAYEAMEIPPALGMETGYFQKVPLEMSRLPVGVIQINGSTYQNGGDFLTFGEGDGTFDEIVYVGYGIETEGYSDYEGLDVRGKLLIMNAGEPTKEDGTYLLSGTSEASKWSNISEAIGKRMEVAEAKGAAGVFYVDDANFKRYKAYFDNMRRNDSGRMDLASEDTQTPMVLLKGSVAEQLLDRGEDTAKGVLKADITLAVESENEAVDSENVVAFLRGSERPGEYVVISSHLDHIGIAPNGAINNGADDDGSGTVAMLEIAEAFKEAAEAGKRPKRSIVFLHVTGEEKGLLGSRYYTDRDPIFPLEQTVANLNIDMIGRIDPKREGDRNYIYLIGSDKLSTELHELSERVNTKYAGLELDYTYNDENDPNRFYYRSDHYNFAKNNIPIIFYFNGTHADYHQPGDTPDKINYDLLQNRTRLIFHTAWEIANRDARLVVDKAAK